MRLFYLTGGLALALGAIGVAGWQWAIRWRPDPATYTLQGVDVGADTGEVHWREVKGAGAAFGYVHATDGVVRDGRFAANWQALAEAGMRRGAMHVYSLCSPANRQAEAFVTTVPRGGDALPVAVELDFQPDCAARPAPDVVAAELRHLLSAIETHTGTPTLLKVSRAFDARYHVSTAIPRNLWSVQAFFAPGYFPRPWRMWQASSFRRVPGIDRPANWDVVAP